MGDPATSTHDDSDDPAGWDAEAVTMLMDPAEGDDPEVMGRAIGLLRRAVASSPQDDPSRPGYLNNLGLALWSWYGCSEDPTDLEESIGLFRAGLDATPADDPDHVLYSSNLGLALRTRFDLVGSVADLDEAIAIARVAAAADPPDHPEAQAPRSNLGLALLTRFHRTGEPTDLDEAVDLLRGVVDMTPAGHVSQVKHLCNLANALRVRYDRTGSGTDLDNTVATLHATIAAVDADDGRRPMLLSDLAAACHLRFNRAGSAVDLADAVRLAETAVAESSADSPDRPDFLSGLAMALRARFLREGDLADLDKAVQVINKAVATAPENQRSAAAPLTNQCLVLSTRFDQLGDRADLDAATAAGRAAVAAAVAGSDPADPADQAMFHCNLGFALLSRFERTGERADIDDAVASSRAAVGLTPAGDPDFARYSSELCGTLLDRFGRLGDPADLDEAVSAGRAAVAAVPAGHPDLALYLSNLANALRAHASRSDRPVDPDALDEPVAIAGRALDLTASDHPSRAALLSNLGVALRTRFRRTGQADDQAAAIAAFAAGAAVDSAAPLIRARAARAWAERAADAGQWRDAVRAFDGALDLLPQLIDHRLGTDDRQHHVGTFEELGRDAAAAALNAGLGSSDAAERALIALERGRGLLLGQGLDTRADVEELRRHRPELAAEFERVRRLLNAGTASLPPGGDDLDPAVVAERRRSTAEQWRRLLADIRATAGLDRFLLPPTTSDVVAAARGGAIVAVNISRYRSDAIVVTATGVDLCPLPGLTQQQADANANRFLAAVHDSDDVDRASIDLVLEWLWDEVAEPVLTHLGHTAAPLLAPGHPWPRLWWLPTGSLTLLPLHAAGRGHGRRDGQAVLDRVMSSYTPTIRALRDARSRPRPTARKTLLVAVPEAADQTRLGHGRDELDLVAEMLAADARQVSLVGPDATRGAVLAQLTGTTSAHFICHAETDPNSPADSCLVLHDGPLRVRTLVTADVERAELAYLSSCSASFGGSALMDEALHVCSTLQMIGFIHVIGALWPIPDRTARVFAEEIYRALGRGETQPVAVHLATRRARAERPSRPYLWATYQHIGP